MKNVFTIVLVLALVACGNTPTPPIPIPPNPTTYAIPLSWTEEPQNIKPGSVMLYTVYRNSVQVTTTTGLTYTDTVTAGTYSYMVQAVVGTAKTNSNTWSVTAP